MSHKRYQIDLAFKEPLSPALQGQLTAFEATIHNVLRNSAEKIISPHGMVEDTTRAVWHICHHDTVGQMCEPESEI